MKKNKISTNQFRILVTLHCVGSAILVVPSAIAADAKQDAWIPALLGIIIGVILIQLYAAIGNLSPDKTLIELHEYLLGKWIGKAVSLLFFLSVFLFCGEVLYYLGSFLATQVIDETPILLINIAFMLVVAIGVRSGVENLARSAEILFPWFVIPFIALICFITPQSDFKNLQPIVAIDLKSLTSSTFTFVNISYLTFPALLMLYPAHINRLKEAKPSFLKGGIIGGAIMCILILLSTLVLGPFLSASASYPSYELGMRINIGTFLQGIEIIIAIMWFISLYFKLAIYFYSTVSSFAQIFGLKEYKAFTMPFAIMAIVLSITVYPSISYQRNWDSETWLSYSLIFGLIYPLFLFIVGVFRKKRQSEANV
ncbi:GerAB/ArcD/ProY family transporter [Priestia flexa]|uniref:GerAB/ArcD/ProY family transporter n=1 Tax=Priestia flexa TaxID=86664 RepID=UPI001B3315A6|nr:endospore germination permease [Priestia flexa]